MKRFLLVVLGLLFSVGLMAQNSAVQGTVVDFDKFPMPGALVSESVSGQSTVTNDLGQFTLTGLSSGEVTLVISSVGYQDVQKTVTLGDNELATVNAELTAGSNELSEVIVTGNYFRNQAKALAQQRQNTGVTNVVNADQIGRTPDANIGDALKRISGIKLGGVVTGTNIPTSTTVSGIEGTKIQLDQAITNQISAGTSLIFANTKLHTFPVSLFENCTNLILSKICVS